MATILVGTVDGLHRIGDRTGVDFAGHQVTALAAGLGGWLALVDAGSVWLGDGAGGWSRLASVEGPPATCLVAGAEGVLVGTAEAHLVRVVEGIVDPVVGFDEAPDRARWYTPWGGPPDTRSLALAPDGTVYANVHVGGILRSADGGESWQPTIDVDTDVHQVLAPAGRVLAASAYGLAHSPDGGDTWDVVSEGLHATYLRAVATAGDDVLVSASTGPGGGQSALYRRPGGTGAFERCRDGLPEWLGANVDTGWLAATSELAAFAGPDGSVRASPDGGLTWEVVATDLPRATWVAIA
jgi:hypothetical protein